MSFSFLTSSIGSFVLGGAFHDFPRHYLRVSCTFLFKEKRDRKLKTDSRVCSASRACTSPSDYANSRMVDGKAGHRGESNQISVLLSPQ